MELRIEDCLYYIDSGLN